MSRQAALDNRNELEELHGSSFLLAFVEISHEDLVHPIRLVSDVFDYERGGEIYVGAPFTIGLLSDQDAPPEARLTVPNVDQRIGATIRKMKTRAKVRLDLVSSDDFDPPTHQIGVDKQIRNETGSSTSIYGFREFELVDIKADAMAISGRLFLRDTGREMYGKLATQARCPGLYR